MFKKRLIDNRTLFLLVFLLYITPTFIQFEYSEQNTITAVYLGLPFTQTGDEPHYYITLYSLVNDHDLFLTNNYNNAFYRNGSDLGKNKYSSIYNRHTRLFNSINKTITNFPFINNTEINEITTNLSYIPNDNSSIKEISGHPSGLPFFAFLFLWPLINTSFLEPAAIYLTLLFSLLGLWAFYKIMIHYHNDENKALFFTLLFGLAAQYWHYSKTFWAEPYLASLLIISWYLLIIKKSSFSYFTAGFLLGFGFLIKYPFVLTIIPINGYIFYLVLKKQIEVKYFVLFCIPLISCVISLLSMNYYFTNNPLHFNQAEAVAFVNPLKEILNWLFNPAFGLFTFSPVLLFAFWGIKNFWKKNKEHAVVLGSNIGIYSLFWMAYIVSQGGGGGGYSARYLVPLIPFMVLYLSFSEVEASKYKTIVYIFLGISVLINTLAAFAYPAFEGYPLGTSFLKIIRFLVG